MLLGKRIYQAECMQCHGVRGDGDAHAGVPALHGQHYAYLLLQTRQMPVSHGYDIGVETLERFEDLKLDELAAVCDYISWLPVDALSDTIASLTPGQRSSRARTYQTQSRPGSILPMSPSRSTN